jgi:hypothetical protein
VTEGAPFDRGWLRKDLGGLVSSLEVGDEQRHFLSSRWLENVLWMEAAAQRTRTRYYALRLVTVVAEIASPPQRTATPDEPPTSGR